MKYDPEKHHRRSIRMAGYDYRTAGAYFATVCAAQKRSAFGKIEGGTVRLHPYGRIVEECWQALPAHFAHVELDEFVVMPNHFHAIVIFTESIEPVGAGSSRPQSPSSEKRAGEPRPYEATLGQVMGYFKYQSTKRINIHRAAQGLSKVVVWQRNYYERIIRDEKELNETRRYIGENPLYWDRDIENPLSGLQ